ncbi:MAG: hypothetical protein IKK36_08485 [Bacteroidales bacterium]|nr:hypothetical protein [Bacteroidales bacterium]
MDNNKYKGIYRSESTRLQKWDYGWNAIYFVTICTQDRNHYFGEIVDGKMNLSPVGVIADILWYELKNHFNDIKLDAFVVMPNHIHGIIFINKQNNISDGNGGCNGRDNACVVPTVATNETPQTIGQQRFQHQGSHTLSSIVGSYKSAVSKHAHRLGYEFSWQSRFYDNIVRDSIALNRIQNYIQNNPSNWNEDKFYLL